jgi:hypothetical protein
MIRVLRGSLEYNVLVNEFFDYLDQDGGDDQEEFLTLTDWAMIYRGVELV